MHDLCSSEKQKYQAISNDQGLCVRVFIKEASDCALADFMDERHRGWRISAHERLISSQRRWKGFTTDLCNYEGFYILPEFRIRKMIFFFLKEREQSFKVNANVL